MYTDNEMTLENRQEMTLENRQEMTLKNRQEMTLRNRQEMTLRNRQERHGAAFERERDTRPIRDVPHMCVHKDDEESTTGRSERSHPFPYSPSLPSSLAGTLGI